MTKRLPTGIQNFEKLRKSGCLYVDKTDIIYRLISEEKPFFLSRPRRFGKSLLLSTIESIFKGQKELFEGLWIADKINWDQKHPVIKLDWTVISHTTREDQENSTASYLKRIGESYQIVLHGSKASNLFEELIVRLHEKNGRKVVVLIDEYDVPILDKLGKPVELIEPAREFLQEFYRVLKAVDEHLQFVLLTGITKFTKVSVFSALNNLVDITLDKKYTAICGWTQKEIEDNFDGYLGELACEEGAGKQAVLDAIRYWYNGFSWDGVTTVYNPFSTLLLFTQRVFTNYWFSTANPTFLVNIIKNRNDIKLVLEPVSIKPAGFDSFDYQTLDTKILLFQTGYLTIKQIKKSGLGISPIYILGIPNNEVRESLLEHLVSSYTTYPFTDTAILRDRMRDQLLAGNVSGFEKSAKELFAGIPYQLHIPVEAYYHSLMLLWLNLLGFEVQGEVSTSKGRIDAVWTWNDYAVIAEVKFAAEGCAASLLPDAFKQIHEKKYYERYTNRKVSLLAVGFTGKDIACAMHILGSEDVL